MISTRGRRGTFVYAGSGDSSRTSQTTPGRKSSAVTTIPNAASATCLLRFATGVCALLLTLGAAASVHAQSVNFAGVQTTVPVSGLTYPSGVAVDRAGNLFVSDSANNVVWENPAGGGATITVSTAPLMLSSPGGIAVDASGNLYIADFGHSRVVEVPVGGGAATVLSTGTYTLRNPLGVGVDTSANVYVADTQNGNVVEVPAGGGTPSILFEDLLQPEGVAVDAAGNVYVAEFGEPGEATGDVLELPVGSSPMEVGSGWNAPAGIAVDAAGNVYVADYEAGTVVEVTADGGSQFTLGSGLNGTNGVALDGAGDVFISDSGHSRVEELQLGAVNFGNVNVCPAGQTTPAPCSNTLTLNYNLGPNTTIGGIQILTLGAPNLDFTEGSTTCVNTGGSGISCVVSVAFAPLGPGVRNGAVQFTNDSNAVLATTFIYGLGQGPAVGFSPSAQTTVPATGLSNPAGVAVDGAGDIYIADYANARVVKVPAGGGSQTPVGSGLSFPWGVVVDGAGDVFIADSMNQRVVEVTPNGAQTTLPASVFYPIGLALDGAGDLFIADSGNNRVVELPAGGGAQFTVNTGSYTLNDPIGVALDAGGDLYIGDSGNARVLELPAGGGAPVLVNTGSYTLVNPYGVAVDAAGDLFIADYNSNGIGVIEVPAGGGAPTTVRGGNFPWGLTVDEAGDLFIADYSLGTVSDLQRSQGPTLTFAATLQYNTSTDSPQSVTVQNSGNQTLTAIAPGLTAGADFPLTTGSGTPPDCGSTFSLASGASCNVSIDFVPQATGSLSEAAVFTDNALNTGASGVTQSILLNGLGYFVPTPTLFGNPANPSYITTATFDFDDADMSATFQCSLDSAAYTPCLSGVSYSNLSETSHTWSVEAVVGGNEISAPLTWNWGIVPSQVSVTEGGTGTGTVSSMPGGISCPSAACTAQFDGVLVTLTATANAGSVFTGWTTLGNVCPGTGTCTVDTGNSYQPVTANFAGPVTLGVSGLGTGTGHITDSTMTAINCYVGSGPPSGTCSNSFTYGTMISLTAQWTGYSVFDGWGGACASFAANNPCTLTLTSNTTVTAQFDLPASANFTVQLIGTGTGQVTDVGSLSCAEAGGVITNNHCMLTDTSGQVEMLTAAPGIDGSTFGGWGGAASSCGMSLTCNVNVSAPSTTAIASFAPGPTTINVIFAPSTSPQTKEAIFNCPSNTNPCGDPNAHALALTVPSVSTGFTMSIIAHEVSPFQANGDCASGNNVTNDFDCRFVSFFTFGSDGSGGEIVPLCDPYSNGNCVFYSAVYCMPSGASCTPTPGVEPPASFYQSPVNWLITWNNDAIPPPAPYQPIPRLYDDPDSQVNNTDPYGTSCSPLSPMLINGVPTSPAIFCQFVYDITTTFIPGQKVDSGIGGTTRQFNDVVVAFPVALNPTFLDAANVATIDAPATISFTNTITAPSNPITNVTLNDPLPPGPGTPVTWVFSAPFAPPGTCLLNGAAGSQVLSCTFGTLAAAQVVTVGVTAANAPAGQYLNASTVTSNNGSVQKQTLLSIATVNVQLLPSAFGGLSGSQTDAFGAPVNLSGTISANDPVYPPAGETVSISIAGVVQKANIGASGAFKATFTNIPASTTPYVITYQYAGDANFAPVTNTSTMLTVSKVNSTTTITSNAPNPSTTTQAVTVGFKVTGVSGATIPTGSVTVTAKLSSTTVTCSGPLTSGAGSCQLTLSTAGAWTLTASYGGDTNYNTGVSGGTTQTVNAPGSTLKFSPSPLNFGNVYVGTSEIDTITVTNAGTSMVTFSSFSIASISGDDSSGFLGVSFCPKTLNAGKSCTIIMSFTADSNVTKTHAANLVVADNAAGSPQTLLMTATVINPVASLNPTSLSFGNQKTGTTSASKTITLTNTGTTQLTLSTVSISGNFALATGTTCAHNTALAANANCLIKVTFTPTSKGSKSGTVTVTDNALHGTSTAGLSGTGN